MRRNQSLTEELELLIAQLKAIDGVTTATVVWTGEDDTGLGALSRADAETLGFASDLTSPYILTAGL